MDRTRHQPNPGCRACADGEHAAHAHHCTTCLAHRRAMRARTIVGLVTLVLAGMLAAVQLADPYGLLNGHDVAVVVLVIVGVWLVASIRGDTW